MKPETEDDELNSTTVASTGIQHLGMELKRRVGLRERVAFGVLFRCKTFVHERSPVEIVTYCWLR